MPPESGSPSPRRPWLEFGFGAPAWRRVLLALTFGLVAAGLVAWVERRPVAAPLVASVVAMADRAVVLRIASTFPVASWTLDLDGQVLPLARAGPDACEARFRARPGSEVLITVQAAETAGDGLKGLQVELDDGALRRSALWGQGRRLVGTVAVP